MTVIKEVINDNGGQALVSDFDLFVDNTQVTSGVENIFAAGDHVVSEANGPSGYAATIGGDCDENGNVTVVAGQSVSCTITNDDIQPTLTVTKVVVNDDEGTSQISDFDLFVGQAQVVSGETNGFDAGMYTVSENGPAGYTASFSGDCNDNGEVTLNPGDIKSCTITNDDNTPPPPTEGSLTVTKVVINDDGRTAIVSDFTLSVNDTQVISGESNNFPPGDYSITESGPGDYNLSYSGNCDENGNITIVAGEQYTCTLTNDDTPLSADLEVVKTVDDSTPNEGDTIVFTITVTNNGPDDASGVELSDLIPAGLTYDSDDSGGDYDSNSGVWTIGNLANGASVILEITATVDVETGGDIITNTATVSGNENDPNEDNNTDDEAVEVNVPEQPELFTLTITKSGDGNGTVTGTENQEDAGTFCDLDECHVDNEAQEPFQQNYVAGTEISLTANPDEDSTFDGSWSGACSGTGICLITMNSNQSVNAHFGLTPPPPPPGGGGGGGGGSTGGGGGGGGSNPTVSLDFDAVLQKTIGNAVNESLTVTNTGVSSIIGATLEITFPSQLNVTSMTPNADSFSNNVGTWNLPTMAVNDTFTVDFTVDPQTSGSNVITSAKVLQNTIQLGFNTVSENIGSVAGASISVPTPEPQVAGEQTTLPRTGAGANLLLIFGIVPLLYSWRKVEEKI